MGCAHFRFSIETSGLPSSLSDRSAIFARVYCFTIIFALISNVRFGPFATVLMKIFGTSTRHAEYSDALRNSNADYRLCTESSCGEVVFENFHYDGVCDEGVV